MSDWEFWSKESGHTGKYHPFQMLLMSGDDIKNTTLYVMNIFISGPSMENIYRNI